MSADIRELLKEKEKRGSYCATCLSTRNIKAAVSTVERKREIKGDIARKKIYVVRRKGRVQHHAISFPP
jgi:hypothetical protein